MKILCGSLTMLMLGLSTTFAQKAHNLQQTSSISPAGPIVMPSVFPTPVSVVPGKGSIILGKSVVIVSAADTDPETVALVRRTLKMAGVETITTARQLPSVTDRTCIVLGLGNQALIRAALKQSGAVLDSHAEGYTISSMPFGNGAVITLAGRDNEGLFYAAQTFRQLAARTAIPALVIQDHPAMPIRGTIEGFYGAPWSMTDRSKHLSFLASVKANTYIYSPKDEPYARDRWREPYPAATLKELAKLVDLAQRSHINFVYAISPGPTICFSEPADLKALEQKFDALRSIGVHSFYVALDDIEYTKWNCEKDKETFGPSGPEAAGIAQSKLLNALQANLSQKDPKAPALIMVPTEYYDAKESPYKAALRKNLDPRIVVQWTGTDVVPPAISIRDAKAATKAFGRKTLLWDNYPVNDYGESTGRLLLAPYAKREAGISAELSGILSNPMNQEAPSRVAVTGVAAFAWNDKDYDPERTMHAAASELANGDTRTTNALLTFFDTQHLAPTFGSQPWQEQAPLLKAKLDHVREAISGADDQARQLAITGLIKLADDFANTPELIRAGVPDPSFAETSAPWLDAMQKWGKALQLTAAGLEAAAQGSSASPQYFAGAKKFAAEATAIQTIKGATRFGGPVKIADGVLDKFIAEAPRFIIVDAQP